VTELACRISTRGVLDRLALVRGPRRRRAGTPGGPARRTWEVDLGLEFDPSGLGEYWIGHCQGFLVDTPAGEPLGVVDDVRVAEPTGDVAALEISSPSGFLRTRRFALPVDSVRAILPLEKRVLAEPHDAGSAGAEANR
jgi:hypothetical protein